MPITQADARFELHQIDGERAFHRAASARRHVAAHRRCLCFEVASDSQRTNHRHLGGGDLERVVGTSDRWQQSKPDKRDGQQSSQSSRTHSAPLSDESRQAKTVPSKRLMWWTRDEDRLTSCHSLPEIRLSWRFHPSEINAERVMATGQGSCREPDSKVTPRPVHVVLMADA